MLIPNFDGVTPSQDQAFSPPAGGFKMDFFGASATPGGGFPMLPAIGGGQPTPPPMTPGGGAKGPSKTLEIANNEAWAELEAMNALGPAAACLGAAGNHSPDARGEAAAKLIGNHARLLQDVCNPSTTNNIDNIPLTQLELLRVPTNLAHHVDEGLREVARRLLGRGAGEPMHTSPAAVEARAACARYLDCRIQGHPEQKPGRTPDMSAMAAAAMKAVLIEVGSTPWEPLHIMFSEKIAPKAMGAAGNHSKEARAEAASKLIGNHFKLLQDVCNPMSTTNVDQIEFGLTQLELIRVDATLAAHVDEGLREVFCRLWGRTNVSVLNPSPAAVEARFACARYLDFRIQSTKEQRPGRKPDMSAEAAAAMKAVLIEVGTVNWEPLKETFKRSGANPTCTGAANGHSQKARQEAANAVLNNHFKLLQDICNPSKHLNVNGIQLTQTELTRVNAAHAKFVDEGMREAIRRLMSWGQPIMLSNEPAAQEARGMCAKYLEGRIQSVADQKPGRKPDMNPDATAALLSVLHEVSSGQRHLQRRPSDAGAGVRAVSLAAELEQLAMHLKLGGELTARQANELSNQLKTLSNAGQEDRNGPQNQKSSACAIM